MRYQHLFGLILTLTLFTALPANAAFVVSDVINMDFNNGGTVTGNAGVYDDPDTGSGAYWNGTTNPNVSNLGLYDADGTGDGLTGITLTCTGQNTWRSDNYGNSSDLLWDYFFRQPASGTNVTATLNNVPAGDYQLYVYVFSRYTEDSTTTVTVNGTPKDITLDGDGDSATADATYAFTQGVNYEVFDVTLASAGSISTVVPLSVYAGGGNRDAILNGMQLVSVPEPSTLAALGLLGVGLLRRRKR